jgi:hypothetical protein
MQLRINPSLAMPAHLYNWYFGWGLILSGFITGAVIGLYFHRDEFLGGYDSFRRRILRLGHISQPALGMVNVLYGLSPWPDETLWKAQGAALCFMIGGLSMPTVCFLTAWRKPIRHLFFIPVTSLILGAVWTLQEGPK